MRNKLQIGDIVCDMHYGPPTSINYTDVKIESHTCIDVPKSSEILSDMLDKLGVTTGHPHNKEAVIVGKHAAGSFTAAYSINGYLFGMFRFSFKQG